MSNRTRSIVKTVAVVLVIVCVAMQLEWLVIPAISAYRFWIVVIAFGILLFMAK